jgi:hypothetical protein
MEDLVKLALAAACGWAGYRAYQARERGVPLALAFKQPARSLELIRAELDAKDAAGLRAAGLQPGPRPL